ncbi:hypothetical protein GQ54DRAFT_302460 [Martensiomyces pterosporus]|nr:hypothetical protein GQ54DRAFT_302460 [Martensiomyces pterosporus]
MSIDSSSERWSFENLGQSTDSGYPLLSSTESSHYNKPQNTPLSQVLGSDIGSPPSNSSLLNRSPSGVSTKPKYLQRHRLNGRAESIKSDASSICQQQHYNPSQQQQNHYQRHQHMYTAPEGHQTSGIYSIPPTANHSGSTPRSSVYSDRAVFTTSRQRETDSSLSSSPPLSISAIPPSAHTPQQADWQQQQRQQQPQPTTPTSTLTPTPQQRPQSIVALSTPAPSMSRNSLQQQHWDGQYSPPRRGSSLGVSIAGNEPSGGADYNGRNSTNNNGNSGHDNVNPLGRKTYALPAIDTAPQNALEHSQAQRIRIERDYSMGDARQFALEFPGQLRGKIDEHRFKRFVRRVNAMLAEAEGATMRNVLEGCLAYVTLYISTLFIKPQFKRTVDRISRFIAEENEALFRPAGLSVIDPKQTAFMFIEIISL